MAEETKCADKENFEKEKENDKVRTKRILKKKKKTTRFEQRVSTVRRERPSEQ